MTTRFMDFCNSGFLDFWLLQHVFTVFLTFFKTISIENRLQENITTLSSLALAVFICTSSKLVTDLHDTELHKRQRKTLQHPDDPPEYISGMTGWKIQKISVFTNSEFMPQLSETIQPSSSS